VVASAIQGGAVHIAMFLVGRFISGLGVGMMQVSVPIYQSELSPAKQRGLMVGGHGILIVCGYAMAAWTGLGCYFAGSTVQWRLCLSLQLVAPLLLLIGSPWLPESPRWLIAHNKEQEGLAVLQKLHVRADDKGDTDHIAAKEEFYQIRKQLELERETGVQTFLQMIKRPSYRKRIYCGVLVQFAAQSTGVLVVNNYQILLYNSLGLSGWLPLLLYGVYTSWAAFLNWINALLLDRVGRKPVIIIGLSGCICMICIYTAMVAEYAGTSNRAGNAMGVLFLFLFVTFYGSSVGLSWDARAVETLANQSQHFSARCELLCFLLGDISHGCQGTGLGNCHLLSLCLVSAYKARFASAR
jgi:MFS family permease